MRMKSEVNLSPVKTPMTGAGYSPDEAVAEAERCLDCPAKYCQKTCPIHTPVPDMCRLIRERDFEGAYKLVAENNALTAMSCRVCPVEKQCQAKCTRSIRGEAVNTNSLEQFVNDWHKANTLSEETKNVPTGEKIAVVGSGPAGLSCAIELLKAGCRVTVYDRAEKPGGVPRWGIPDFILEPEVTEDILAFAENMGAEFICDKTLGTDFTVEDLLKEYKAVFLGIGAPIPVSGGFDNAMQAQDLLREVSLGRDPLKGKSVAVIGGGDTAIDAVRTARKLSCEDVLLIYRRGGDEMPARDEDMKAAEAEGIKFLWWTEPVDMQPGKLICRKTEPAPPDYPGGRKNARSVPGTEFEVSAEMIVLALGFKNAPVGGVACDGQGRVLTDESGRTNVPGVYAGGDAVSGPSAVTRAAAAGKMAAIAILDDLSTNN